MAQVRTEQEQTVWVGSPSQWLNFRSFALSALASVAVLALLAALWPAASSPLRGFEAAALAGAAILLVVPTFLAIRSYLEVRCTGYTVTTERIRISRGILSRRTDDTEMYRVDDILLDEPLLLRLVSRANVVLMTSDRTTPTVVIEAVPKARELRDQIRRHVEIRRDRKKTRVLDFE